MGEIDILYQDKMNEECGVFGVINVPDSCMLSFLCKTV